MPGREHFRGKHDAGVREEEEDDDDDANLEMSFTDQQEIAQEKQ